MHLKEDSMRSHRLVGSIFWFGPQSDNESLSNSYTRVIRAALWKGHA